jgi:oxygen-dependent protoporphyrinogen oxidase
MMKLQHDRKNSGSGEKVGAGPGGTLTSFYHGMAEMIEALKHILGDRLRTGLKVVSLERKGKGYSLFSSDGSSMEADIVVIAAPAYSAAEILKNLDPRLSHIISGIPYPSLSVVCFGYKKEKIKASLDGFGFLVPSREKRRILGTLWDSSIFPNRAPEGFVLLRSMVGGARASSLAMENDDSLVGSVKKEIAEIMNIRTDPDFIRVYRHEMAIPQYIVGHGERLKDIDALLPKHKGLYLTGNAYRGIGVNDCVENSFALAARITEES